MKNYLDFEKEIKELEQEVDGLKSPFGSEGISEVDTNKIKNIQYSGTPLQFSLNYGDADISGIDLNFQLFNTKKWLGYKAAYSSYTFSDQLSFPMQPADIFRQSVVVDLGNFIAKVGLKNEGSRIVTTVDTDGALVNNYLKGHRSLDVNVSYQLSFSDYALSIGIFGQNLNDDSQALEGISIIDKRVYLSTVSYTHLTLPTKRIV